MSPYLTENNLHYKCHTVNGVKKRGWVSQESHDTHKPRVWKNVYRFWILKLSDAYSNHWALNDPSKNSSCPHFKARTFSDITWLFITLENNNLQFCMKREKNVTTRITVHSVKHSNSFIQHRLNNTFRPNGPLADRQEYQINKQSRIEMEISAFHIDIRHI
jgi:hypothetical protein